MSGALSQILANADAVLAEKPTTPTATPSMAQIQANADNVLKQQGPTTPFIDNIIAKESGGDPNAVSPKGARGVMQIMTPTAIDPGFGVKNIFDRARDAGIDVPDTTPATAERLLAIPSLNVGLGTDYANAQLTRYNGNEKLAAAAFNAGPGAVDSYGGVPPYAETQAYVADVPGSNTIQPTLADAGVVQPKQPSMAEILANADKVLSEAPPMPPVPAAPASAAPKQAAPPVVGDNSLLNQFSAGAFDMLGSLIEGPAQNVVRRAGDPVAELERQSAALQASTQPTTIESKALAPLVPQATQERALLTPEVPKPLSDNAAIAPQPDGRLASAVRVAGSIPPGIAMAEAGPLGMGYMTGAGALGENEAALRAGQEPPRSVPLAAAGGAAIGAGFSGLGKLPFEALGAVKGKLARYASEAALGTAGFPALEGRAPEFNDYLFGAGMALPSLVKGGNGRAKPKVEPTPAEHVAPLAEAPTPVPAPEQVLPEAKSTPAQPSEPVAPLAEPQQPAITGSAREFLKQRGVTPEQFSAMTPDEKATLSKEFEQAQAQPEQQTAATPQGETDGSRMQDARSNERTNQREQETGSAESAQAGDAQGQKGSTAQGKVTSTKNAVTDAEREARGAQAIAKEAEQSNKATFEKAKAETESNPYRANELIDGLNSGDITHVSEVDEAVLLNEKVRLMKERDAAAVTAGDEGASESQRKAAYDTWTAHEERIDAIDKATRKSGQIWGRLGQYRQRLMAEDYSFAGLERKARAAKGGALTPEESAIIEQQAARIADLEKQHAEATRVANEGKANTQVDEHIKELLAEVEKERKAAKRPAGKRKDIGATVDSVIAEQRDYLASASEQLGKAGKATKSLLDEFFASSGRLGITPEPVFTQEKYQRVKPHLDEIYKNTVGAGKDIVEYVRQAVKKFGAEIKPFLIEHQKAVSIDTVKARIEARIAKGDSLSDMRHLVRKASRYFVEQGVTQREPLVKQMHEFLKQFDPEITRHEARDIMSGYGHAMPVSKDEITTLLAGYNAENQAIGKLRSMTQGEAPKATGQQRREPTNEKRRLEKFVNDKKRAGGFTSRDPEAQLKSALDAVKTRLRNGIRDLENAIDKHKELPRKQHDLKYDEEATRLKAERDALQKQYDETFPKAKVPLTQEQQVARVSASLDRSIAAIEADLKAGKLYGTKGKRLSTPEIEAKRARLDALREERDLLRSHDTATIDERNLRAQKARASHQIADAKQRLAAGDFAPKKRQARPVKPDAELTRLAFEKQKVIDEFNTAREKDRLARRSNAGKVWDATREGAALMQATAASFDASAPRQGAFLIFGHPIEAMRAMGKMFKAAGNGKDALAALRGDPGATNDGAARRLVNAYKAFTSGKNDFAIHNELMSRPHSDEYTAYDIVTDQHSGKPGDRNEIYQSRLARKIPGIAMSERMYTTLLNVMRANRYDALRATLVSKGYATPEAKRLIANYVNVVTGRGDVGSHKVAVAELNRFFWAPRFVLSRFQTVLGEPLWKGLADGNLRGKDAVAARTIIAKEYNRSLAGIVLTLSMAKAAGLSVGIDPSSSDFGKIIVGDTRYDFLGGLGQAVTFLRRAWPFDPKFTTPDGEVRTTTPSDLAKFAYGKASPMVHTGVELVTGVGYNNEPVSKVGALAHGFSPIGLQGVAEALQKNDVPKAVVDSVLSELGVGVSTHN